MDISENIKEMKQVALKYGDTKYALGRAVAHNEMINALATYIVTQLSDENVIEAFENFQMMIRDDLEIEEKNTTIHLDELYVLLNDKGENE
ncbi:hypothetical protein EEO29_04815 [Staphylococcus pseudintermedius]|uniref:Uncharacterized protein n=1 Tax=Staphylococcus lutrae TaxID=155085 RepID=A0AAC9WMQ0_9STAP|nr:hypothetical protein [Staphylococcus lutrae]EGQ1739921.1 hypothetical protein [Staphylococcus pseudintermedius]ARJ51317.1 hypothetical protein B5P37_08350 [Staphylococcus lutrae]EGQ2856641.1 hypothetical protein [Staphylococcus pseudintermedius]EGQ2927140.1 hypothetical protein [Staphylococcus pseudintermedius]EGQ3145170.1 hypothetical protein [Staphylococcus pseudintermedius]